MRDIYDSVVIRDKEKEKQERRFAELAFRLFFDRAIKSTETSYDYFCFLHDLVVSLFGVATTRRNDSRLTRTSTLRIKDT